MTPATKLPPAAITPTASAFDLTDSSFYERPNLPASETIAELMVSIHEALQRHSDANLPPETMDYDYWSMKDGSTPLLDPATGGVCKEFKTRIAAAMYRNLKDMTLIVSEDFGNLDSTWRSFIDTNFINYVHEAQISMSKAFQNTGSALRAYDILSGFSNLNEETQRELANIIIYSADTIKGIEKRGTQGYYERLQDYEYGFRSELRKA